MNPNAELRMKNEEWPRVFLRKYRLSDGLLAIGVSIFAIFGASLVISAPSFANFGRIVRDQCADLRDQ
jgi:hypothetical protein